MDDEEEINLEDTFDITHELENPNSPFANSDRERECNAEAPGIGPDLLLVDGYKSETEDESLGMSSDISDQTRTEESRTFLQSIGVGVVFIQCYFVTIACILGTGILGLPVTLSHSGFLPFLISFLIGFVVQALLIYFFIDVLQRAHAYNIEKHKCLSFEEQQVPLTNLTDDEESIHGSSKARHSHLSIARKVAKPNLHMMGTLFLGRGLSQAFDIILLLQFVSILISYALAGSEAYAQLFHIEKYLYIIPAFVWILSGSIVFAQRIIQPVVSLFTLAKGGLLVATVVVTFGVGSAVGNTISNDFHYMGSPFLMGTVALGGVCNVMPMMYSRIAYSRKQISSFWWTVFAGLATCMILNVLWCWAVLDIVPQLSSCTTHLTEEVLVHDNTTEVNIFTTPSVAPCVEDLSLERSAKQGEISTVPLIEILEDDYPQYTWVAVLVELFIMISITVSYLTIGSALLHSFLGWLDAHMAWDKVDKGNTVPAKVKYCPKRICRPLLSLLVFGLVFAVAMLDPKGFVTMLDKIASLLLNLEAGLFIFLMIRRSNSAKYRSLIIPYPVHRLIYPAHYIIAIYFLFAVVYDITVTAIEWFT
ncbi:uncharacterized protein LOC121429655 [Lytechinus variegatus]|uniref:uncharacterized protein LOC121429655 n=1 Tax=Lytechinus variegatus TaxID=7654 RepID=UPI001BB1DCBE|nr:uncharacterized protein LOC121429655 [Lytechinus variegatus]